MKKAKSKETKSIFRLLIEITALIMICVLTMTAVSSCSKGGNADVSDSGDTSSAGDDETAEVIDINLNKPEQILDENGNVVGEKLLYSDGSVNYIENWNAKGDVVDSHAFNVDGTPDIDEKYTYNGDGTLAECETVKYYYTEDGKLESYNRSVFNSLKMITSSYNYNAEDRLTGFTTYEYDEDGNLIRENEYGENNYLVHVYDREYSDFLMTKETISSGSGTVLSITLYEYNENGTIAKQSECDPDGNVQSYCLYVYGEDGTLSEEQVFVLDEDGEFVRFN